jgi:2-methylcitrate dehydratase PrpD
MTLLAFAEELLVTEATSDICERHIQDTAFAFAVGMRTAEGRALSRALGPTDPIAAQAAIARLSECDAIHLPSCVTPCAVAVPVALAFAKDEESLFRAVAGGAAAGMAIGRAIGGTKALASGIWPTLFAAPAMAAIAASRARGVDTKRVAHAIALALAQSDGRTDFPPSRRWEVFAQAVGRGIAASDEAAGGTQGDLALLTPEWLAENAGHSEVTMDALNVLSGVEETGFKPFPIARQGLNAVTAFQNILSSGIEAEEIDSVDVFVPPANVALLTRPVSGEHRLTRLCNMGFQLACAALAPEKLYDAERTATPPLMAFAARVSVHSDKTLEAHLPNRWAAKVAVKVGDRTVEEILVQSDYDAEAPNLKTALEKKWARLIPEEATEDCGVLGGVFRQYAERVSMLGASEG